MGHMEPSGLLVMSLAFFYQGSSYTDLFTCKNYNLYLWDFCAFPCVCVRVCVCMCICVCVCMCTHSFSVVSDSVPGTVGHQAFSTGFSRQKSWRGRHFYSRESSQPRDRTHISRLGRQILVPGSPLSVCILYLK